MPIAWLYSLRHPEPPWGTPPGDEWSRMTPLVRERRPLGTIHLELSSCERAQAAEHDPPDRVEARSRAGRQVVRGHSEPGTSGPP